MTGVIGAVRNILKVLKGYFDSGKHLVDNEPAMTGLPVHVPVLSNYSLTYLQSSDNHPTFISA